MPRQTATAMIEENENHMLDIVRLEARSKINDQLNSINVIDQKMGILIGFSGVFFVLLITNKTSELWPHFFFVVSQLSIIVCFFSSLLGLKKIRLKTGLSIDGYLKKVTEYKSTNDINAFIKDEILFFEDGIKFNTSLISRKHSYLHGGILFLLIGFIFYLISYLL